MSSVCVSLNFDFAGESVAFCVATVIVSDEDPEDGAGEDLRGGVTGRRD
jgi:hypothetical protein